MADVEEQKAAEVVAAPEAPEAKATEPPEKKQKTDGDGEAAPAKEEGDGAAEEKAKDEEEDVKEEDVKEEDEKPKKEQIPELEADAVDDPRTRTSAAAAVSDYDATIDTIVSGEGGWGGTMVSSLSQGGFQHLLSGVRATVGAKAGRYLYEVKVIEKKEIHDAEGTLRVGFSTAGSSLLMGDGSVDSICFDQGGALLAPTPEEPREKKQGVCKAAVQQKVVGVLLNLDSASANANTVSIFLDGVRSSQPMKIPEHLHGKALFPTITFKNYTLAVNLGADGLQMKKLPFTCRMFADLAGEDADSNACVRPAAGSKYTVVVPVGLPEEGYFDHIDRFLEQNPSYFELSDRKVMEWCQKSGLRNQKWGGRNEGWSTRDRPTFRTGVAGIDNRGIAATLKTISQLAKRNFVVAELKSNLVAKDRELLVKRFASPHFRLAATVAMGEPPADQKEWAHKHILEKHAKKKAEQERRKAQQIKANEAREAKNAERIAKIKAAREKLKKKKDVKDEVKEEEVKEETAEAEEPPSKKQKVEEDEAAEKEPEVGPGVWFVPQGKDKDVDQKLVASSYMKFSLPTTEEGFEEVSFVWKGKDDAQEYFSKWVAEKKASMVIEGLKPSDWFAEKLKAWQETKKEMLKKQRELQGKARSDGDKKDRKQLPEELPELDDATLHGTPAEGDAPGTDPVYIAFVHEDWALLSARYELHLLFHSFVADAKDSEHPGVPAQHLARYFQDYFKTHWSPSQLGCSTVEGVAELAKDMLKIEEKGKMQFLTSTLDKDTELLSFVKLVEEDRRDRVRRIEAGDESARLKFPKGGEKGDRKGKGGSKGKGKGKRERGDRRDGEEGRPAREGGAEQKEERKADTPWKARLSLKTARTLRKGQGKGKRQDRASAAPAAQSAAPARRGAAVGERHVVKSWSRIGAGSSFRSTPVRSAAHARPAARSFASQRTPAPTPTWERRRTEAPPARSFGGERSQDSSRRFPPAGGGDRAGKAGGGKGQKRPAPSSDRTEDRRGPAPRAGASGGKGSFGGPPPQRASSSFTSNAERPGRGGGDNGPSRGSGGYRPGGSGNRPLPTPPPASRDSHGPRKGEGRAQPRNAPPPSSSRFGGGGRDGGRDQPRGGGDRGGRKGESRGYGRDRR